MRIVLACNKHFDKTSFVSGTTLLLLREVKNQRTVDGGHLNSIVHHQ